MIPLGFGHAWIKGSIHEQGLIDNYANEHGVDAGLWLSLEKNIISQDFGDQIVYLTLKSNGVLNDRLGPLYARVTQVGPQVFCSNIIMSSNPSDYGIMRINVSTF